MSQLPTNRTSSSTITEHVDDHNTLHAQHNDLDGHAADTTAVHGVADTSALETTTGAAAKVSAHEAAGNPHPTYATDADLAAHEGDTTSIHGIPDTSALLTTAHTAAADPHTAYQRESEKSTASGYASLDAGTKVPTAELGGAGADNTKFLRGDQTWQVPSSGGGNTLYDLGLIR